MLRRFRRLAAALTVAALLLGPAAPASADLETIDPQGVPAMFDLFVLRPVGLVVTAVGLVAFVPAAGLTAIFAPSQFDKAYKVFVEEPITFTFREPLGSHAGGGL